MRISYLTEATGRADDVARAAWFRLFVGDLSNDVSDDVLSNAFNKYPSFQKARVIRDRLSGKVRVTSTRCDPRLISTFIGQVWLHRLLRPRRLPEGLERNGR